MHLEAFVITKLKLFCVCLQVYEGIEEDRINATLANAQEIINHGQGRDRDDVPVPEQVLVFLQALLASKDPQVSPCNTEFVIVFLSDSP